MKKKYFVAFDLGATSGRTILGTLDDNGLTTEELTRFPNKMLDIDGHLYWNIYSLYDHIAEGLEEVARRNIVPESIGIDTWGVDVACVSPDGKIMGVPNAYRDCDTIGSAQRFFDSVMTADEMYDRTGIQHLDINTIFQLHEHRNDFAQLNAESILFMPDALNFMLTGKKATEYTIASTGEFLNPYTRTIDRVILTKSGVDPDKFAPVIEPGTRVGTLLPAIASRVGLPEIPVIAVASHDTQSAIAAIPASNSNFAYLSSGTWSLMGIESAGPAIDEMTRRENITNEGGVFGTVCQLKTLTGMWVVEQCLKKWKSEGTSYSYPEMVALAQEAEPFKAFIDPDHRKFVSPADMPAAIREYCAETNQPQPQTHGEYVRIIFESLAMKYRDTLDSFRRISPHPINVLHVIGGGSRNDMLNQLTANAAGIPVIAGPAEASAIGNIMMQTGCTSLGELREIVGKSVTTIKFEPSDTETWDEAFARYKKILS